MSSNNLNFATALLGYFTISSMGVVALAKPLDYELVQSFPLIITVTDNGASSKSSQVSVQVMVSAVNEHSPVFTNSGSYTTSVSEDSTAGSEIIRVTANDGDTHSEVEYAIIAGNDGSFYIDSSSGAISVLKTLDRESIASHTLTVRASDGLHTANASVLITVSDVNDNSPVCSPTSYAAIIAENAAVGSSVVRVTCSDDDEGVNKELVYRYYINKC